MQPFETIKYKGCTIELIPDEDSECPREWDNVGEILYTSTRYTLGDRRVESSEIRAITEQTDVIYLPVYAYIHSGTRLNTTGFSCPWDSGQCGIIWCTKQRAVDEWGKKHCTPQVVEKAKKCLRGEIAILDAYFNGEVIGFVARQPDVLDEDGDVIEEGEEIDSCWGFYPEYTYSERYRYPISVAKASIDRFLANRAQQDSEVLTLT
jgi:hypothetical protein